CQDARVALGSRNSGPDAENSPWDSNVARPWPSGPPQVFRRLGGEVSLVLTGGDPDVSALLCPRSERYPVARRNDRGELTACGRPLLGPRSSCSAAPGVPRDLWGVLGAGGSRGPRPARARRPQSR